MKNFFTNLRLRNRAQTAYATVRKFFGHLHLRHWAWAHVLAAAAVWWPLHIILTTPEFLKDFVNPVPLFACMWIALVGGFIKIAGFLASQQPGKTGVLGVSIELIGLVLSLVGPIAYLASYTSVLNIGEVNFGSAFIFAYVIAAMYIYRLTVLIPRFRREAKDPTKSPRTGIFKDMFKE